jgi:glycosyltransferase involved in cell wall biosynthesis
VSTEKKISVIIPVYNAEKYVLPTLQAVRFQTYPNLEIVCVLDCPTDRSEKIVRDAAKQDQRIKIVACPTNVGPAETRNIGIRKATGEYIHFMDSDDLISYDFYQLLLDTAISTNADVSTCSVFNEKKPKQSIWYSKEETFHGKSKIHKSEVLYRGWMWRYLIKKKFWDEYNFSFPNFSVMQDIVVAISVVHHANKLAVCPDAVYFYKNRPSSTLNRKRQDHPEQVKQWKQNVRSAKNAIKTLVESYKIKQPNKKLFWLKERITGKFICTNDPIEYGKFEKRVSVIVPVYNVEKYLARSLNSIRFQTYKNLEIICVLDCPTDNSAKIAIQIAGEDSRVKLIAHPENKGLPAARHTGVENATGEYIHFMDSDDWLSPDFYETLVHGAEKANADVAACSVYYEKKPNKSIWFRKSEVLSDTNAKFKRTEVTMLGWAWRYLIRRNFWNERNFYFPDLVPMEDKPVMISMMYYANAVVFCPAAVYFYKNRENSILNKTHDAAREKQKRTNRHKARKLFKDFMKTNNIKQPSKLGYYLKKYFT